MPLRLTEDAGAGHPGVSNPVWSGVRSDREYNDHEVDPEWCWPDPDDPATEGYLLALLGSRLRAVYRLNDGGLIVRVNGYGADCTGPTLGRAAIAAAEALGRWPNGGQKEAE